MGQRRRLPPLPLCSIKSAGLYASFLKGQGHQGISSFVKGTLWGNCKFLLENFNGTKAMSMGHGGNHHLCLNEVSGPRLNQASNLHLFKRLSFNRKLMSSNLLGTWVAVKWSLLPENNNGLSRILTHSIKLLINWNPLPVTEAQFYQLQYLRR